MGGSSERACAFVVLRGFTHYGDVPAERVLGSFRVFLTGEAKQASWPNARLKVGDVEGLVWTTRAELASVINQLLETPGVVDARGGEGDPTRRPPPAR